MLKYILITTVEGMRRVANLVHEAKLIGFDIETARPGRGAVFDPRLGKIRLMQFNIAGDIYVVDLWQVEFYDPLIDAMRSSKAIWIIHNAKYEQKWLWYHHKLELWPVFDTFRAAGLIYNGRAAEPLRKGKAALDLDSCVVREMKEKPVNTGKGGSNWAGTLSEHQLAYAAEDVSRLPQLRERLWEKMRLLGLFQVGMIEFSVVLPEAVAELNGFPVDPEKWTHLANHHRSESRRITEELLYEMPNPSGNLSMPGMNGSWNLNSPPQLLRSLHRMGCDVKATDHNTLAMQVGNFEVIKKILTWREHVTRLKMFGPDWLTCIHPETGRVHTSYYSLLAAGRYSSSDPNLQQIPRQAVYRSCFVAPAGKVFVLADYSGIEMRIVAEISGDEKLIRIFCNDEDAHYATAALIMAKKVEEIIKRERQMAKPVNFGFIYGMGAERLVLYAFGNYGVAMTLDQAKLFRTRYFSKEFGYAGVASWHRKIQAERASGMKISRTMAGRLRFLDPQTHYNEYFNCLDAKTEALTQRGWVPGLELTTSDRVLTKNAETGELEWQQPQDVRKWLNYEGPLVEFRSRSFNAVSTPNHRWLVKNHHSGRNLCKTTSEISVWGDDRIHRTGHFVGASNACLSDDEVEFAGWLLTDGSLFPLKDRNNRIKMTLTQSERGNPAKVARIDRLIHRLGWGHSRHVTAETGQVTWAFQKAESERFAELFPRRTLSLKYLNCLTRAQLLLLRDVMLLGDGHVERNGKTTFVSGDREHAGLFQALCTLCGSAASLIERDGTRYKPKQYASMPNIPRPGKWYVVMLQQRTHAQVTAKQRREYVSKEPIWCPIVPNTYFVARREGQVFITGNTPIQGTGADALKLSLRNIHNRIIQRGYGDSVKLVHHVHDEIILECDDDPELIKMVKEDLEAAMVEGMSPFLTKVPIVVDASHGKTWADAK